MGKKSAGILVYRKNKDEHEVFLVHPGGPFWAKKDLNSWSIPKGEFDDDEEAFAAAKREFNEETSYEIRGEFIKLEPIKQPGGKMIYAWAVKAELDETKIKSNLFKLEWPIKSGNFKEFPEIDKAKWFSFKTAKHKMLKGQLPILENMANMLGIEFH
jgi:predicted NUDIX family NTP pyrophosphohydrolase